MSYFYVLQSQKDQSLYYGSTRDLRKRLKDHNNGKTRSNRSKIPFKIIYYEGYSTYKQARKRELHIKKSGKERNLLLERLNLK